MCTAVSWNKKSNYFGRTLDVEVDYKTSVVIMPRNFLFGCENKNHFAIIGMAMVIENTPLYFDATNEAGLSMAGLNFPGNAKYFKEKEDMLNIAPFKLIPYVLGNCETVKDAKNLFKNINITNKRFKNMPLSPLHWIVSDREESITIEQTEEGLKIFENKVGVLTNNPTFDWHVTNLVNYLNITCEEAKNTFLKNVLLRPFCKGLGGRGLPGDLSSPSRFVRACFAKNRAVFYDDENKDVNQFFHILGNVEQTTGLAKAGNSYEQTLYTSCCNVDKGIYYYKTYFNSSIKGVNMHSANMDGDELAIFPVEYEREIEVK